MNKPSTDPADAAIRHGGPPPFHRDQHRANAETAADTRTALGAWLQRCPLSATTTQDILLAVNEAVANAVEHAYRGACGTVELWARYDQAEHALHVTVQDHGTWRPPVPAAEGRLSRRGRGLVLMRALADHTTIESTPEGTLVGLAWRDLVQRTPDAR